MYYSGISQVEKYLPEIVQKYGTGDCRSACDSRADVVRAATVVWHVLAIVTTEYAGHPLAELVRRPWVSVVGITAALSNTASFEVSAVLGFGKSFIMNFYATRMSN